MTELPYNRQRAVPTDPIFLCMKCGRDLKNLDVALHKKLINRGSKRFMCIECLSEHMGVTTDELRRKAEQFKKMGCTMFL